MTTQSSMCKAVIIGAVAVSSLMFASGASAAKMPVSLEDDLIKVCEAIRDNNRLRLHQAVKNSGLSFRTLADKLVCNGQDMLAFAATHGADNTHALIARRTNLDTRTLTAKR